MKTTVLHYRPNSHQDNSCLGCGSLVLLRPDRGLHLSDMGLSQKEHAQPALPYSTADRLREITGTDMLPREAGINMPPRIRMTTVYAVAQCHNGRVANTCNLSEDWVGYSTRYGDAAGDFSPLAGLTVQEVKAIGRLLGLPDELVEKPPIDGLCGKTDEDNLGFTYAVLDRYIRTGEIDDREIKEKIDRKHKANLFKLRYMPVFDPKIPTI